MDERTRKRPEHKFRRGGIFFSMLPRKRIFNSQRSVHSKRSNQSSKYYHGRFHQELVCQSVKFYAITTWSTDGCRILVGAEGTLKSISSDRGTMGKWQFVPLDPKVNLLLIMGIGDFGKISWFQLEIYLMSHQKLPWHFLNIIWWTISITPISKYKESYSHWDCMNLNLKCTLWSLNTAGNPTSSRDRVLHATCIVLWNGTTDIGLMSCIDDQFPATKTKMSERYWAMILANIKHHRTQCIHGSCTSTL